ncbi:inhibitor of nuclear factor kappa-B kinase subunit alpha [Pieris rapae]|uniref:inhibitor of nuclear factor kappa-B kinase subunit alpha n=1 Tax=Pieris rapae TaxID=64459 RepID=UPI001E27E385|nr:inhibitor of nuclear factor kappa-B kinase subunit alpha [Pieris rapae]
MEDIIFIGDWVKDRVLGSGSFGTVVLWKHKEKEEKLAIKTCKWGDELTTKHRERWTKEVEMLQTCNHPNIVRTKTLPADFITGLSSVNPSKLPILCMEYCGGGDLRQSLNSPDASCGLKEVKVRKILSDIGSAMRFLHSNKITHRDLKPENVVIHFPYGTKDVTEDKIIYKIIDLGYAKEIDSNSICASFVGTLQYLAPEIFYSKTYSNSVDFWSLGLLAFEIISGTRPFLPFKTPVEWMPFVKKKQPDNICVYETFHGDIEYSNEIFAENHISQPFKKLMEDWLRVALQWDPKLRGRDAPSKVTFNIPCETKEVGNSSKVIIFDMLQNILSKKIIKIYSLSTLSQLAYDIDSSTKIITLKEIMFKDTGIPVEDQLIISHTNYMTLDNDEQVIKYWNENVVAMLFLYNKKHIIQENNSPIVPKAVQRCLEHPKALYNFKNSQTLHRNGLYFVITQMEVYDLLINALFARAESLKQEGRQLLLKQNDIDKQIGKLYSKIETIKTMIDTGEKHITGLKENNMGTNILGGFSKLFKDGQELADKVEMLTSAWAQLSIRLQSAARRSNEGISTDLNNFVPRNNYQGIFANGYKAFVSQKKSDFYNSNREKEKQCPEIVRVCYDTLKLRSKILQDMQNQQFLLKLKDLSIEFDKISDIIMKVEKNLNSLSKYLAEFTEEFTKCIWSTITVVVRDADNISDLPYSVVSYQKRDFKIGQPVTNYGQQSTIPYNNDIKSVVAESLKLRQNQTALCEKLNSQKNVLQNSVFDFSFLKEN